MFEYFKNLYKRFLRFLRIKKLRKIADEQWRKLAQQPHIKLELGSGPKQGKDGWITVDMYGADINYDLKRGIPLADNSVDAIYSSHFLEHIAYQDLLLFLSECKRVMKPGGYFSVCVPDIRQYIDAYINKTYFRDVSSFYQPAAVSTNSYLDQVNYVAYMGGQHKYMFDQENLVNILTKVGFNNASIRDYDNTIDLSDRQEGSIYAIAYK